jgi:hypothetical protein
MIRSGEFTGIPMRLRERLEHFGDALILLAQADGSRDPQDAAHQLLAQFVRPYLANARRHNEALAKLDRMIKAEMSLKPELAFLPLVRKLIAAHRPLNVTWVCPGEPPAACRLGVVNVPSQGGFEANCAAASP